MGVLLPALATLALIGSPAAAEPGRAQDVQQIIDSKSRREIVRGLLTMAPSPDLLAEGRRFLITFDTQARGVEIDEKLRTAFPKRMTVILQYDYLVLRTDQASFTLRLHFDGVPKIVTIPYDAIREFQDPSIGLHFVWDETASRHGP